MVEFSHYNRFGKYTNVSLNPIIRVRYHSNVFLWSMKYICIMQHIQINSFIPNAWNNKIGRNCTCCHNSLARILQQQPQGLRKTHHISFFKEEIIFLMREVVRGIVLEAWRKKIRKKNSLWWVIVPTCAQFTLYLCSRPPIGIVKIEVFVHVYTRRRWWNYTLKI